MGQPLSRAQDETGALSRSAGFPVAQSVPKGAIRMVNEVVDDDVVTDNESDDGEVKIGKKKMIDYTKKLLEMRPDLSKWTGANNRANNTGLRTVIPFFFFFFFFTSRLLAVHEGHVL